MGCSDRRLKSGTSAGLEEINLQLLHTGADGSQEGFSLEKEGQRDERKERHRNVVMGKSHRSTDHLACGTLPCKNKSGVIEHMERVAGLVVGDVNFGAAFRFLPGSRGCGGSVMMRTPRTGVLLKKLFQFVLRDALASEGRELGIKTVTARFPVGKVRVVQILFCCVEPGVIKQLLVLDPVPRVDSEHPPNQPPARVRDLAARFVGKCQEQHTWLDFIRNVINTPDEDVVERHTQAPNVCQVLWLSAFSHLWSNETRRPTDKITQIVLPGRKTEISEKKTHGTVTVPFDKDVGRFDVPVDIAKLVQDLDSSNYRKQHTKQSARER